MNDTPKRVDHGPVMAGQEGIAFLVNQTSRAFRVRLGATIIDYGLDTGEYTILRHLVREMGDSADGVALAELSDKLNMPMSELEPAADKLVRDKWVTAIGSGRERRLTPLRRAITAMPVLVDASRWLIEGALNGFSRDEIAELSALLNRVLRNLDAAVGEDEGPLTTTRDNIR